MNEIAISVKNVKKKYRLGQIGGGSLQGDLQSWWAKKRGKEDPNSIIGSEQRLIGKSFFALNGVNIEIKKGEAVGIIGKNGAGKSTLLKLLSRVTAPTEGTIDIYGRITSMLEVGTGFHKEMTGRENVYMNGAILGMSKEEVDSKMADIIEFSEVGTFIDTPVKRYSSGMYVKLAFSVAAHLDSEIMIMDEVLAVGDMAFQKKCLSKMSDAARLEGKTILYVSHNMNTIRQLCDRVIVLDEGKVIFDGNVEKGIDLYLKSDFTDQPFISYDNVPRLSWLKDTKIRTLSARFVNKDAIDFNHQERMVIELCWVNEKDVSDLCLRIELLKVDRSPIATGMVYNFYSGKTNESGKIVVSLDISHLAPGKYASNYTFFEKNEFGTNINADCVHGLYFNIEGFKDIVWDSKQWGNIRLDNIEVEDNVN